MIIRRTIDNIIYCTECQSFCGNSDELKFPLVLNWLITNKCNLNCQYCFATDIDNRDYIPDSLIHHVNKAEYLKLVISGGEPFENDNIWNLLNKINHSRKAIVIDTNGTHNFKQEEIKVLKEKNITIRISLDSVNPRENEQIRKCKAGNYYEKIIANIELLWTRNKVNVALQTVVTKSNIKNLVNLAEMIRYWKIPKWYIQPIIPSGKGQAMKHFVPTQKSILKECSKLALDEDIFLIKEDENHKSVLLLNNFGTLITEDYNENIEIGNIENMNNSKLFEKIDKENHLKRYKLFDKCMCRKGQNH